MTEPGGGTAPVGTRGRGRRARALFAGLRRDTWFLVVGGLSSLGSLGLLVGVLVVGALLPLGVGWPLLPPVVRALRWWAGIERRRVAAFTGTPVTAAYPPLEGPLPEQLKVIVGDASTRRDLAWLAGHGLTGHLVALLAVGLPLGALNTALVPTYWYLLPEDDPVAPLYPVTSWALAAPMPLIGVAYAGLTLGLVPLLVRFQVGWARLMLAPSRKTLRARVAELTASRAAVLEAHGAELRRIERDLHDGTQNRIVSVVMHLGIIERALRRDPASALPLILRAQDAAGDALAELRDVVRGIYPPILTERGLDGAVAALVAHCPIPCTVTVEAVRRLPAAVEAAAYFVVAEALTNIAKHSGAGRGEVRLSTAGDGAEGEVLVIEVTDDGHGGAVEAAGSGLLGIRRRVSALDGRTELRSPVGGPTVLRVELPCGS